MSVAFELDVGGRRPVLLQVGSIDGVPYVALGWVGDKEPSFCVSTLEGIEGLAEALGAAATGFRAQAEGAGS